MKIKMGSTRWVLIIGRLAFKFPALHGYKHLLMGILGNLQESQFSKIIDEDRLCPVLFSFPFGLMNIMPYAEPLKSEYYQKEFNYNEFMNQKDYIVPVENKICSFGVYRDKIVAVDYGSVF